MTNNLKPSIFIRTLTAFAIWFSAAVSLSQIACAQDWWSADYALREQITVSTDVNIPDKGYLDYTVRLEGVDTESLVLAGELQPDCDDLRLVYWDGITNTELPRHLIGCNQTDSDIRFALASAQSASAADGGYYLYYSNPAATAGPAVSPTNVYLWYDDGAANRLASYDAGRIDAWHGSGWSNSFSYNAAGYYTFNTGDNFTDGLRIAVDERDIYIETEFFHTGCFPVNMTSGIITRGIIGSGAPASESSTHYYASNRAQNDSGGCPTGGYAEDGDIFKSNRANTIVDGPNPPAIAVSTWRRQGLATWSVNPTNLSFYDENIATDWNSLGYPNTANLQASGSDASDFEGRGFAGILIAQDRGRMRNVLIRRYTFPEPTVTLGAPEMVAPSIVISEQVSVIDDPLNGSVSPYSLPGSTQLFTLIGSNTGNTAIDADTIILTIDISGNSALLVVDFDGVTSGPIKFTDGTGSLTSGLSYTFAGLSSTSDDVDFSSDGINFNHVPSAGVGGSDSTVSHIRLTPQGSFASSETVDPEFTFEYKTLLK